MIRTGDRVILNPDRDLPLDYDSATGNLSATAGTGNRSLGTKAPGAAGGPALNDVTKAHGLIGEDGLASILVDTALAALNVYVWNKTWNSWVKGGAVATDYSKAIEINGQWAFTGQEGTPFYLYADVTVTRATVHARKWNGNGN
jgi:hypothetical protein